MFSVGVGPSSSHTVGPMRAANAFVTSLQNNGKLKDVSRVRVTLYGSLSLTGLGHGTDRASVAGLEGNLPDDVDTEHMMTIREDCKKSGTLTLAHSHTIEFDYDSDVVFEKWRRMAAHPNGMRFVALDSFGNTVDEQVWYSIGGGFIRKGNANDKMIGLHDRVDENVEESEDKTKDSNLKDSESSSDSREDSSVPYPFTTCKELISICKKEHKSISDIVWQNELALHNGNSEYVRSYLLHVWEVMEECVENGCNSKQQILPGGLEVHRRAPRMYARLAANSDMLKQNRRRADCALEASDSAWVNLFALAVSEENAGGGRIVTAPTNGSAGIIPAVLQYYWRFVDSSSEEGIIKFLLASGAVGYLFKRNASISGAEVGCQGEVGSACSMAAAGLCEVLGGTPQQVENAAEIGIEHHLGLTCDPVGGLVQIPCIERNAMAANTAINAVRMALLGDGSHIVSLDSAIKTMKETGQDMMSKYRETSKGGLAVNVVEC
ncbi:L-serine ammonia-lyase [Gardnerella piotii]|uniref:L-serine ammonia-lyase n=1 Tax=Gardnerella piotii TaxID=2792977 RepID=UPI003CE474C5